MGGKQKFNLGFNTNQRTFICKMGEVFCPFQMAPWDFNRARGLAWELHGFKDKSNSPQMSLKNIQVLQKLLPSVQTSVQGQIMMHILSSFICKPEVYVNHAEMLAYQTDDDDVLFRQSWFYP